MATGQMAFAAKMKSFDELNPYAPDIEQTLKEMDLDYKKETGKSPFLERAESLNKILKSCYQRSCAVFISVDKATQTAELFINGYPTLAFKISSGTETHPTPDFDRNPNGRIYDAYSSQKYPGGENYNGLGNMPYAIFIHVGFALHGTPSGNWSRLGTPASHGCIRMHPDNALIFNGLVRQYGHMNTWITIR